MAELPEPIALDEIERRGATRFGATVARAVLHLADGRRVALDLPRPDGSRGEDHLSQVQRRVLEVVENSPAPLTRKAIAARLGQKSTGGRFGQEVRELIDLGKLYESGGGLTDDPGKFGAAG